MSLVSHLPRHGVTLLEFPAARALTAQLCTHSAHCKVTHPRIRREFAALSRGWCCAAPGWPCRCWLFVTPAETEASRVQLHSGPCVHLALPGLSAQLARPGEGEAGLARLPPPSGENCNFQISSRIA